MGSVDQNPVSSFLYTIPLSAYSNSTPSLWGLIRDAARLLHILFHLLLFLINYAAVYGRILR